MRSRRGAPGNFGAHVWPLSSSATWLACRPPPARLPPHRARAPHAAQRDEVDAAFQAIDATDRRPRPSPRAPRPGRRVPLDLAYHPGLICATTRVPRVAYGLGVTKQPSGACSASTSPIFRPLLPDRETTPGPAGAPFAFEGPIQTGESTMRSAGLRVAAIGAANVPEFVPTTERSLVPPPW